MIGCVGYRVPDKALLNFAQATSNDFMPSPSSHADINRLLPETTVVRDGTYTPVDGNSCL
jgi:hypothetical protein